MKTLHSILTTAVAITALAGTAGAQSLGTIYPKSQGIATTGSRSGFGTGSLWENSLGDSWNYPTWKYAYGTIKAGYGDSQAFVSVTNRNFIAAVTTPEQLGNFMAGRASTAYAYHNLGYGTSGRYYGSYYNFLNLANNTTVGYGLKTSKWSGYSTRDAETSFMTFLYSNWGYQPGYNPNVNRGAYSATAWSRAGWVGPFNLNQSPLAMGQGRTRRWAIGEFTTAIDSRGYNPHRFVFTTAASLSASTQSDIFIIPKTDQARFLAGSSFSSYGKLSNTGSGQEVVLPAGRTFCVAVRDGVNTTSSEGAQVLVYAQYYR